MTKKRVDSDSLADLKQIADDYWAEQIQDVRDTFEAELPPRTDRTYMTKKTEKMRLIATQLSMLRELAKHRAGLVHENGSNTQEEKLEFERMNSMIAAAKRMVKERSEE